MPPTDDRPDADSAPDTGEAAALRARVAALEAEAAALRRGLASPDGAALRQILDGVTGYAVVTTDLDRRILAWNEGARRLFGWTEAEALGQRCDLIFTPEDRANGVPEQEAAAALAQGRATDERWHARRDGSRFWGSGFVLPLRGPGGRPEGLVKIMRDGTAEREAENRLRESEERLRQIAETIDDVFWVSQPSPPRAFYLSPAFERV